MSYMKASTSAKPETLNFQVSFFPEVSLLVMCSAVILRHLLSQGTYTVLQLQ